MDPKDKDLIYRIDALVAALDATDDWDGGPNPERDRYIREAINRISAVVPGANSKENLS